MRKVLLLFFFLTLYVATKLAAQLRLLPAKDSFFLPKSIRVLPQNFYTQQLSFFCKKEVQLQKLTSLPLYLRAGSKDYVDYLERKPNAVWQKQ